MCGTARNCLPSIYNYLSSMHVSDFILHTYPSVMICCWLVCTSRSRRSRWRTLRADQTIRRHAARITLSCDILGELRRLAISSRKRDGTTEYIKSPKAHVCNLYLRASRIVSKQRRFSARIPPFDSVWRPSCGRVPPHAIGIPASSLHGSDWQHATRLGHSNATAERPLLNPLLWMRPRHLDTVKNALCPCWLE